jgi:hypothetical protein
MTTRLESHRNVGHPMVHQTEYLLEANDNDYSVLSKDSVDPTQ